jgi:hypothetical protein
MGVLGRRIGAMNGNCILLNGDFTFLGLVDWKKAMGLMFAEKIRVLKFSDRVIQGVSRTFRAPAVAVLARDRFACAYCGSRAKPITMDHVIPRSRGGKTDFDNCVACCRACNHRKGALLPREAGMALRHRPWQPTIAEFIRIRLRDSGVYGLLVELGLM